jgi:lipopolysaccharide exporter
VTSEKKAAIGVAWMASARMAVRALGLLSTLFLARLLAPADFGLVAMATVIASGLELLTLFNFDMALVQTKNIHRAHYDSAWSLNVAMGAALAALLVALAGTVAAFYSEPRLTVVMWILAAKYLVDARCTSDPTSTCKWCPRLAASHSRSRSRGGCVTIGHCWAACCSHLAPAVR